MMAATDEEGGEDGSTSLVPLAPAADHPLAVPDEEEQAPFVSIDNVECQSTDDDAIVFSREDTSVFEEYSTQGEDNDEANAAEELWIGRERNHAENDNGTDENDNDHSNRSGSNNSVNNNDNNERDVELGLPLADLDSADEEEDETDVARQEQQQATSNIRRRALLGMRYGLHIIFFPVLVITSVAIPILIVMFCFALMFVAMVVLLCVYYCCSPRRGDGQAAVPFHVLIRQILEAVEDETGGLGVGDGNDTPKYSKAEIQNCLVRRKLIHFECSDPEGNVVVDPEPTDEATREERMHQDMFPVIFELSKAPIPSTDKSEEGKEEEEPKATGFRALFKRQRKQKNSKKDVHVIDHNKSYELRMANQKIKFTTDPISCNSKLFLLKRTFVFSPPLGPAKVVNRSSIDDDDDSSDDDEERRNYNLAVAALEDDSSSSSSGFLRMLASSSESSSDSSSERHSAARDVATVESSDMSFLSERSESQGIIGDPNADNSLQDDEDSFADAANEVEGTSTLSGLDDVLGSAANNSSFSEDVIPATTSPSEPEQPANASEQNIVASSVVEAGIDEDTLNVDLDAVLDIESGIVSPLDKDGTLTGNVEQESINVADAPSEGGANEISQNTQSVHQATDPLVAAPDNVDKILSNTQTDVAVATSPPASEDVVLDTPGEVALLNNVDDEGDNPLETSPQERNRSPQPPDEDDAVADVATLMIHPAFLPLEETKMEISPGEETKEEVDAYDEREMHGLSSAEPTATETKGAEPLDAVSTTVPTDSDEPAGNDGAATDDAATPDPEAAVATKAPTVEQPPEHRGISSYCNICLLEYEVGDIVVWSRRPHGCHHAWHEDCLLDWLTRKPTCPNCRQEFFAIEDAPPGTLLSPTAADDDSDNSVLAEGNHTILPESTHTIPIDSGHSSRFLW